MIGFIGWSLAMFALGLIAAKAVDSRSGVLMFYTKNKGRTWWWGGNGREFKANKLTDQLQDFYQERTRYPISIGSFREQFYDD